MNEKALQKTESKAIEYIPLGGQDKVKLSINMVQSLVAVPTRSGKTCSERDAIKFLALCQARRLNPFEGDCYLIGYDGKDGPSFSLITSHQAFLKRAELSPEYDGMVSGIIIQEADGEIKDIEGEFRMDEQRLVGGWAQVNFKTRKTPCRRRVRLQRFYKDMGLWRTDPEGMIVKCAEADALRSSFPSMCGGLYGRQEMDSASPPMDLPAPRMPEESKPARTAAEVLRNVPIVGGEPPMEGTDPREPQPEDMFPAGSPSSPLNPADNSANPLESVLEQAGIAFDDFLLWAVETGQIPTADGIASCQEIPKGVVTRLVRTRNSWVPQVAKGGAK